MNMQLQNVLLFSIVLLATCICLVVSDTEEIEDKCDNVYPCTCKMDYDGSCIIMCYAVSTNVLQKLAEIPNLCNGSVDFILIHSKVRGIPVKLWKSLLSSEAVDVTIKYSTLEYLVLPEDGPLPALYTPKDAVIKVVRSGDVEKWQWEQLSTFKAAEGLTLIVDDTPMKVMPESFSKIANGFVIKLTIDMTGLEDLPDKIFKTYTMMHSLSLQNNKLKEIKRSDIPIPAAALRFLALNGNSLSNLPSDLFAEMPSLETVYLRGNLLTTLPDTIFQSVNSQSLGLIDLINNPWNCDCNLIWIAQNSTVHKNMGNCASPEIVKDKAFNEVRSVLQC